MSLTNAEYEAAAAILKPIKAGRKKVLCRKRSSLGDAEFVDSLLSQANLLGLAALEAEGSIVFLKPGHMRWLLNPQSIAALPV